MFDYQARIEKVIDKDVVVCGGGCAGVMAAIAASRIGMDTILLERNQTLGGTATMGMVRPFMLSFDGKGERQIVKGLFDEMVSRLEKRNAAVHPSKVGDGSPYACYYSGYNKRHNNVTPFQPEYMRLELFNMIKDAGVSCLTGVAAIDAVMEDTRIGGVVVFDGTNLRLYRGKIVIDCTGDAFVAAKAGAVRPECKDTDTDVQPMSLFFSIYGADDKKIEQYVHEHPEERGQLFYSYIKKAQEAGTYPIERDKIGLYKSINPGEWALNTTRIQGMRPVVAEDLTEAFQNGLSQVFFLMDFFKTLPGLENARLKDIAPTIGIRESRRILGMYTLTAEDIIEGKSFDDSVAMGSFMVDMHPSKGSGAGIAKSPLVANCFEIPYRILVPQTVENLLVAGRCVSATREAIASIRVMPQAFALGQAAGAAAALSVRDAVPPKNIDVSKLQKILVEQNVVLH
jgi:hypothetical protein